jgi:hypothetical protein
MRIRTRLLILILAILVPTFSAATLAVGYVYLEERRAQENSVKETVRAFALLVDNELEIKEGILRALASSPSLARGELEEFYRHARQLAPTPETVIVLHEPGGRQLLNTRVSLGSPLPTQRASNVEELMDHYGVDRTLVTDMFKAPLGGAHDFLVQVPVRVEGRIRYFLSMGVNAKSLQSLMSEQRFPDGWVASIIDRKGRIVARSRDAEQMRGRSVSELALRHFAAGSEGVFPAPTCPAPRSRPFSARCRIRSGGSWSASRKTSCGACRCMRPPSWPGSWPRCWGWRCCWPAISAAAPSAPSNT